MDFLPASCGGSSAHVCFDFPGDGTSPFDDDYKKIDSTLEVPVAQHMSEH